MMFSSMKTVQYAFQLWRVVPNSYGVSAAMLSLFSRLSKAQWKHAIDSTSFRIEGELVDWTAFVTEIAAKVVQVTGGATGGSSLVKPAVPEIPKSLTGLFGGAHFVRCAHISFRFSTDLDEGFRRSC